MNLWAFVLLKRSQLLAWLIWKNGVGRLMSSCMYKLLSDENKKNVKSVNVSAARTQEWGLHSPQSHKYIFAMLIYFPLHLSGQHKTHRRTF